MQKTVINTLRLIHTKQHTINAIFVFFRAVVRGASNELMISMPDMVVIRLSEKIAKVQLYFSLTIDVHCTKQQRPNFLSKNEIIK